jgi:hypothetical protein
MTRARVLAALVILLPVAALAACARPVDGSTPGSPPGDTPGGVPDPSASVAAPDRNVVPDSYQGRFRVVATVLESPEHGPQLCSAVAQSLPPQCGGPDIVGWDWKAVKAESRNGTTWGDYLVTGTFDDARNRFTLTGPAISPESAPPGQLPAPEPVPDLGTPCPPPPGGWRPVNPALATSGAQERAIGLAQAKPEYAGAWLDQSYLSPGAPMEEANDPKRFVLNVRFTGDLRRHEADLRRVWGGALCVSQAKRSMADLRRIQNELSSRDPKAMISSAANDLTNTVEVTVFLARESQQRDLDARYGAGTVVLNGWLRPID